MRKMIFILCIPTALLSACSPSGMQGNPAAVQAGAAIGGVLGAIVGDRAGGYNGSQFGALLGTVTGAAVGNAITTPREETYQVEEYYVKTYPSSSQYEHTSSYEPSSGLRIINLRFIDDNRNHVIDAEEDSKLVFDVVNDGDVPAYNVTPVIEEMSGMKHIFDFTFGSDSLYACRESDKVYGHHSRRQEVENRPGAIPCFLQQRATGAVTEAHEFTFAYPKTDKEISSLTGRVSAGG